MTKAVTNPSGYSSLKERLRELDDLVGNGRGVLINPDGPEAAAAIEALEARIAQLEADRAQWVELPRLTLGRQNDVATD